MATPHLFWNQKPLCVHPEAQLTLLQEEHGFQSEPLPASLEWEVFRLEDTEKFEEWYAFLVENYKTPGFPFQIVYTRAHLRMEMGSEKGYWILALRCVTRPGRPMVACIAGDVRSLCHTFSALVPEALSDVLFIEFLCVHPSLRHLRLAPKLIHEISRLAHTSPLRIQKAYYSSATKLPGAFCCSDNYHRPIQWERCIETGYIPPQSRRPSASSSPSPSSPQPTYSFQRVGRDKATIDSERVCALFNAYNARHRKIYEPMTPDHWEKMCQSQCMDCIVVYDTRSLDIVGCIATITHPYKITMGTKGGHLNTVLLYGYGFDTRLSSSQILHIWNELFHYAERELPHWDAFTTVHPEVYRANGFRKGHAYYHYMYNVHMRPLEPTDITMIGI